MKVLEFKPREDVDSDADVALAMEEARKDCDDAESLERIELVALEVRQ